MFRGVYKACERPCSSACEICSRMRGTASLTDQEFRDPVQGGIRKGRQQQGKAPSLKLQLCIFEIVLKKKMLSSQSSSLLDMWSTWGRGINISIATQKGKDQTITPPSSLASRISRAETLLFLNTAIAIWQICAELLLLT